MNQRHGKTQYQEFLDTVLEIDGVRKTILEWCMARNLNPRTAYERRKRFSSLMESIRPVDRTKKEFKNFVITKGDPGTPLYIERGITSPRFIQRKNNMGD